MENRLRVADYIIFALFLLISSAIGIYHGWKSKQTAARDYLLAGQSISWFPLSISLLATYLSAIALLGIPSEIYTYGVEYLVIVFSYPLFLIPAALLYAPIFYRLKITSANEYLEKRFTPGIRLVGACLVLMQNIFYLSVVLYAPSLALEAVAGVPLAASIISTGLVCNFYTTLGGMKGVIWTDVFQAFMMILGLVVVIAIGSKEVGGFSNVVASARGGKRLTLFDFNPDPTRRNTFWSLVVGGTFSALPVWTVGQTAVQRVLSAKSLRHAQCALFVNILGLFCIISLCVLAGLVMYAVYAGCDLRTIKEVSSNDQVLAYFIVSKLGHLTGVPGVFTACLFSGALSSASSGLNSLAAVLVGDIVSRIKPNMNERTYSRALKISACSIGLLVTGLAFLVQYLGTMVLQLAYSIVGIIGAPYLALFTLGMVSRRATWKGAYVGTVCGISTTLWLSVGAILYPPDKEPAPITTEHCHELVGVPTNTTGFLPYTFREYRFATAKFYSLSYLYYAAVGFAVTLVVGYIASLITSCFGKKQEKEVLSHLLFQWDQLTASVWCYRAKYDPSQRDQGSSTRREVAELKTFGEKSYHDGK